MTAFVAVVGAEWRKLLSRGLVRGALVATMLVGAGGPLGLWFLAHAGVTVNGGDLGASLDISATNGVGWSLFARNYLMVGRILIAVLAATSFAGELQARTLREDLVRPVPRPVVLLAKWLALCGWVVLSVTAQLLAAVVVGLLMTSWTGPIPWPQTIGACLATVAAEASIAAVCLMGTVFVRTVSGSVVVLYLGLLFEQLFVWAGQGLRAFVVNIQGGEPPAVLSVLQAFPSSAWAVWSEVAAGAPPSVVPWLALVGWLAVSLTLANLRFLRMDIP